MTFKDIRQKGFGKRISIHAAIVQTVDSFEIFPEEVLFLQTDTINKKILREDIIAKRSIPPFDRSTKDGFSVSSDDCIGASRENPVVLKVIDEIKIGNISKRELDQGTCIQIPTGGDVPSNCDSIVMIENTSWISDEEIEVYKETSIGENISRKGTDINKGELIFQKGRKLSALDRGHLLAAGIKNVKISHTPSVAIIASGDELVSPWNTINPGEIPEVNTINLFDLCLTEGWKPNIIGIIPDQKDRLQQTISEAISHHDIVLVSGGTSVGKKDYIPIIFDELGDVIWHGVAIRPGGPTSSAKIRNKLVFGLPGFPTSTFISYNFIIKPIINSLMGLDPIYNNITLRAKIIEDYKSPLGRRDFLRVKLQRNESGEMEAQPITVGGSGLLRNVVRANGIVQISETIELIKAGKYVDVTLIENKPIYNKQH